VSKAEEYADAVARHADRVHAAATPAQREANNFRQGHPWVHGLPLAIEYRKGEYRTGRGGDGKAWKRQMTCHYGRIKRTVGLDGEPVDVFLGDHPASPMVFVVSQLDADGNLDEHKVMMGFRTAADARRGYLSNYPAGWEKTRLGEIRGYYVTQFKQWLKSDDPVKNRAAKAAAVPDWVLALA
jgi:hypothetical protein